MGSLFTWWAVFRLSKLKDKQAVTLTAVVPERFRVKISKQPIRKCEAPVKSDLEKKWFGNVNCEHLDRLGRLMKKQLSSTLDVYFQHNKENWSFLDSEFDSIY